MKLLSKIFIAFTLLCLTANAHASINLQNYTLDFSVAIPQISDDLSGLTYNSATNTLFACTNGSGAETIYELDLNGNVIRTIDLIGFNDTEGLAWIGGTDYVITEERLGNVVYINITAVTTSISYPTTIMSLSGVSGPGPWPGNDGLEGLAYDPALNQFITIQETPPMLYSFVPPAGFIGIINPGMPFPIGYGFTDAAGLHHLGMNAYFPCGQDVRDHMLILSEQQKTVVETDYSGVELSRLSLTAGGANGTISTALPQPEGVTMDNQGNIYIVSEPNLFYKFENCAPVDIDIQFDGFPAQTSWEVTSNSTGAVVASSSSYAGTAPNSFTIETFCLIDDCYTLTFYDSVGNGMCPFRGTASSSGTFITPGTLISQGSVVATLGTVVAPGLCGDFALFDAFGNFIDSGGGGFGASQSINFCLSCGAAQRLPDSGAIQTKTIQTSTQIQITPNPVNDNAMLYYSLETNEDVHIQLVDITGKIVQQYTRNFNDVNEMNLDVSNLQSGMYFVQLTSGDMMLTEKFIKK